MPLLGPSSDLENQVDPLLRQFDDLWGDGRRDSTGFPIEFDESLDVGVCPRAGESAPGPDRHLIAKLIFLQVRVSFENHPV